jgi:large subunit ribosomal protein L25
MAKEINLTAEKREKEGIKKIIKAGYIPAVVYGPGAEPQKLKLKEKEFSKIFVQAGETHLINLIVDGAPAIKVLVKDSQKNSVNEKIIHIDFYKVDMKKKITAMIPLKFSGEARAVKELGATLVKSMDEIEVECLPEDLVDYIEVDLSGLNNFDDTIKIGSLKIPAGMKLANEADEIIISAFAPQKEEAPAPVAVEPAAQAESAEAKKEEKE